MGRWLAWATVLTGSGRVMGLLMAREKARAMAMGSGWATALPLAKETARVWAMDETATAKARAQSWARASVWLALALGC